MVNKHNLVPNSNRTPSELRKMTKKGGKKSGEVRRERKKFKEAFLAALEAGNTQDNIIAAVFEKALAGNLKAVELIRDTIGEKPVDKQATTDSNGNDIIAPIKLEIVPVEVVHDKTSETS